MEELEGIAKNVKDLRNDVDNLYVIFYKTMDGVGVGKFKVMCVYNIQIIIIYNFCCCCFKSSKKSRRQHLLADWVHFSGCTQC